MLRSLKTRAFRKLTNHQFTFTQGLNALRGVNEIGKSSAAEAICYALFGAEALRDSLDDAVTWGSKASELKVELDLDIGGVTYTFARSKSGAECRGSDGSLTTGQREVRARAAELLGVDPKLAGTLFLASQDDLRGVLEAGPSAASGLLAKLADFDLLDRLVATAEQQLPCGKEQPVREALERQKLALDEAERKTPGEAQVEFWDALIAQDTATLATRVAEQAPLLAAVQEAQAKVQGAEALNAEHARLQEATAKAVAEIGRAEERVATRKGELVSARGRAASKPDPTVLQDLRDRIQATKQVQDRLRVWRAIQDLPAYPAEFWEGTEDALRAEITSTAARMAEIRQHLAGAQAELQGLEAQRKQILATAIKGDGKCPTCGSQTADPDHIARHNAAVQGQIDELLRTKEAREAVLAVDRTLEANLTAEHTALQAVLTRGAARAKLAAALAGNSDVEIDLQVYPPQVTWVGAKPEAENVDTLQQHLASAQRAADEALRAEGAIAGLEAQVAEALAAVDVAKASADAAKAALAARPKIDLAPLQAAVGQAALAHQEKVQEAQTLQAGIQSAQTSRHLVQRERELGLEAIARAQKEVAALEQQIKEMAANNELITALKKMKPKITDDLWGVVLSAASSYAAQIREAPSPLTKGPAGFYLDGHPIKSFSGSAQDSVALAVRAALVRVFLPGVPLLILDEPAAACDAERTKAMLGFIQSLGMPQTLMASHDAVSEAVADNVIQLGV